VEKFAPIAAQVAQATGLPAEFVTAQAALETGYGRSPAPTPARSARWGWHAY